MREIKFRAWGDSEMDYADDDLENGTGTRNELLGDFLQAHYGCELMQYTGLKDKNGVEIYEGDIVDYDAYGKYKILWDAETACFFTSCIETHALETFMLTNLFEFNEGNTFNCIVIGNIYENPELLDEQQR